MTDILESHIVVDDISKGGYFITKGGQYLYVTGSGDDMKIQGSGDIENGKFVNIVKDDKNQARIYNQKNGKTYFVDKPIETATKSVFKTLQEAEAGHNLFYQLAAAAGVFESTDIPALNRTGDMNVKFFDTYRYTVYVPTDEARVKVIPEGKVLPAVGYYADLNNDTIYYEDFNEE